MAITLFGIDHMMQRVAPEIDSLSDEREEMKTHFRNLLKNTCVEKKISLIAEECKAGEATCAKSIAEELGIEHLEIDIPLQERITKGLPQNEAGLTEEEKTEFHQAREQYWLERISQKHKHEQPLLVIIGSHHLRSFGTLLVKLSKEVATDDLLESVWFKEYVTVGMEKTGLPQEAFIR